MVKTKVSDMGLDDAVDENDVCASSPCLGPGGPPREEPKRFWLDELDEKVRAEMQEESDSYDPASWKEIVNGFEIYGLRMAIGHVSLYEVRNEILAADNRTLFKDYHREAEKAGQLKNTLEFMQQVVGELEQEKLALIVKESSMHDELSKKEEILALYKTLLGDEKTVAEAVDSLKWCERKEHHYNCAEKIRDQHYRGECYKTFREKLLDCLEKAMNPDTYGNIARAVSEAFRNNSKK